MKVLKILLYIVLGFVGLFFLVSLFMPSSIEFERSIEIEAPVENVFVQTNVMKNWEKWNPWFEIDPDMEVTYEGAEAGVGASYSWSSDNSKVGSGKQTIIESEPNQHIKTELYFQGEKGGTGYWNYDEVDGKTNVTWGMNGELGFFMRIMGVFMRGMMEDMFDDGLAKIKEIAEAMPTIDISVVEVQSQKVLFVRDSAKISDNNISELYGKGYGEMGQFVGENNIQMTGMPMSKAVVWEPDNDRFVFDLMFPIAETKAK